MEDFFFLFHASLDFHSFYHEHALLALIINYTLEAEYIITHSHINYGSHQPRRTSARDKSLALAGLASARRGAWAAALAKALAELPLPTPPRWADVTLPAERKPPCSSPDSQRQARSLVRSGSSTNICQVWRKVIFRKR